MPGVPPSPNPARPLPARPARAARQRCEIAHARQSSDPLPEVGGPRRQHKTVKLERIPVGPRPIVAKVARVVDEATNLALTLEAMSDLGERVLADVPCEKSERPTRF